jgi:hypothetical protein
MRLPGMLIGVPEEVAPGAPQTLMAHPNPFNSRVTIRYSVPRTQKVSLGGYDVSGRLVVKLVDGIEDFGVHTVHWDGRDTNQTIVASGVYFVRQSIGSATYAVKIVLAK